MMKGRLERRGKAWDSVAVSLLSLIPGNFYLLGLQIHKIFSGATMMTVSTDKGDQAWQGAVSHRLGSVNGLHYLVADVG